MATVTKRAWTNKRSGKPETRYVLGYADRSGKWRRKQFKTAGAANAERVRVEGQLATGVHVPDRASITVGKALDAWLADYQQLIDAGKRERSTLDSYKAVAEHLRAHDIAATKLSRLTGPDCGTFARWLEENRTEDQGIRSINMLRQVLDYAIANGWCSANPAKAVDIRTGGDRHDTEVAIPPKADLQALVAAGKAHSMRAQAMVVLLLFVGLRISELRGLRRIDVDKNECRVRQRADKYQKIGSPKSKKGRRDIPMPPGVWRVLAAWMLQAPKSKAGLLFPNGAGQPDSYANIWNRLWVPLMEVAQLVDRHKRPDGTERISPHFGLHALRHACVSLWIEQGVMPKKVSQWAGHSSVAFTLDTYGHLWKQHETDAQIAAATEASLYT